MIIWRERVVALAGWRRFAAAFGAGALAVLALPPLYIVPALVPAVVTLLWLLDGAKTWRAALALGWWFGWGFFIFGLYWMGYSFLVEAETFAWMIPFAIPGLAAVAAVYIALATLATWRLAAGGFARAALFPAAWTVAEFLRGTLLTGFPWNLLGTVWAFSPLTMQGAALVGAYGLSLVTVAAAAAPAALADADVLPRARWALMTTTYGVLAALFIGGGVRLAFAPNDSVPGVRLRLVQPDVPQTEKWQNGRQAEIVARLMALSAEPAQGPQLPTHIIWPETAVPAFLSEEPAALRALGTRVPVGGALITGAPRIERLSGDHYKMFNSLHVIDEAGRIRATYDKAHLVPFGEYMPFRDILDLSLIGGGRVDFSPGPGPVTLEIPGAPPASPLICYEAIFPAHVVASGGTRPQWLLNITNDAWFGISSGPYQHLASARLRAVEEGLPLVRAANDGVSAVFDGYGRAHVETPLGVSAVADADLPVPVDGSTVFARFGNWSVLVVLIIFVSVFPLFPKSRIRNTI
jgi:apolipoprotein N-acyltransferase